jgi:uncharacterized protein (DUF2235 family)
MDQPRRKLIVCLDGTWNQRDSEEAPTNVAKMARAIAPLDEAGGSQLIYYHPGVGSGDWFDQLVGGGFGAGLSANVESAYSFLADNVQNNDLIYLFGFSRGAFTARSLAGLVTRVGLLNKSDMVHFQAIYNIYRSQEHRAKILGRDVSNDARLDALRQLFPEAKNPKNKDKVGSLNEVIANRQATKIFFVGVWDTVGSLGIPLGPLRWLTMRQFQFHDTDLNNDVRYAYHALAIDERRGTFKPTLWTRNKRTESDAPQTLQQVWFAGCHSNIGGGYDESGLADMSFLWMAAKAHAAVPDDNRETFKPLAFDQNYFKVDNFTQEMGTLVNSRSGPWYLLPRNIRRPFKPSEKPDAETCEKIHRSVIMRYDKSGTGLFKPKKYQPRNAKKYLAPINLAQIEEISDFEVQYCPAYAPQTSS